MRIDEIIIGNRYRKDMGDLQVLADSINEQGLLQAIGVTEDNELVFGQRRVEAFKLLGMDEIEARIVNVTSMLEGELTENEVRKQFSIEERVAIGEALEDMLGERRGKPVLTEKLNVEIVPQLETGAKTRDMETKEEKLNVDVRPPLVKGVKTRDIAAQKAGFGSGRHYDRAKTVVAKASPKQLDRVNTGKSSINAVYKEIKRVDKKEEIARIPQQELDGKYNVFLADPPWRYDQTSSSIRGVADDHYPTMDIEAIKSLPISDMTLDNAVLFLWTTTAMIKKAFDVIDAWGFDFKASMVWVKQHIGTGFYVRSKHEIVLIGIKGSFLPMTMDIPESVFFAKKGEHSKKPEIIYEIIERMYPDQRYIEIFSRAVRHGWFSWGNEVEGGV